MRSWMVCWGALLALAGCQSSAPVDPVWPGQLPAALAAVPLASSPAVPPAAPVPAETLPAGASSPLPWREAPPTPLAPLPEGGSAGGLNRSSTPAIQLASHTVPQAASAPGTSPLLAAESIPLPRPAGPLTLDEVHRSIYASFPQLYAARMEANLADGRLLSAMGEFDWKVQAESLAQPQGFYENYRHLAKLDRPLWNGGSLYGHYRLGDGDFPVWYGERETNEGGEFKLGVFRPLLQDRQIDERRAAVFKAELAQQAVAPLVQAEVLQALLEGADAYWTWVAAGQAYQVQRDLLQITRDRNQGYATRVEVGDLPRIELVQNERLIAARESKLLDAQRKWEQAAIKLSLYLRDAQGRPLLPTQELLPTSFPEPQLPAQQDLPADVAQALQARPELRTLALQRSEASLDRQLGQNQRLAALNAVMEASKDVGAPASPKGDKTPFELEAGVRLEVPLQRRKGTGKIVAAEAKLAQLAAKQQLTSDKIVNEVRSAWWARETAYQRIQRERRNVELAQQLVEGERTRFDAADSELIRVALQESAALEASIQLIEALLDFYRAEAAFRAATAQL